MKRIYKMLLTLVLAFTICFSAVSVPVVAAAPKTAQEKAFQKKQAKKLVKWVKKNWANGNPYFRYAIKSKKVGKKYEFTLTCTSIEITKEIAEAVDTSMHNKMILSMADTSEIIYKKAKKYKLYKPVVYVTWMTADGYQMSKHKNGKQIE